jgi:peptidoglycan/xylan/chitin deacetylase (PgdA/CDA1 family)
MIAARHVHAATGFTPPRRGYLPAVPVAALTFDDGPDPVWTPRVLDALLAAAVKATFFLIGPRAERHPGVVERIRGEGHAIGIHCDEHVRHTERDEAWTAADLRRALRRLDRLGVTPRLWRTPWGRIAPWTRALADAHGLTLVGWTADTHDWRGDDARTMLAAIGGELRAGAVVLAHDGLGPGVCREGCQETVALIPALTERARAAGLRLGALDAKGRLE